MKSVLCALALMLSPAVAQTSTVNVHPTVWHVIGPKGDAWLLGSIHTLPPQVNWHSPQVSRAISASDVFVFEVPLDAQTVSHLQTLVAANGYLPPGQALRDLLAPEYQDDYDAVVKASGLDPAMLAHERPWLAGLQMMFAGITKMKFAADNGPDSTLMQAAQKAHKEVRYLETAEDQFAVMAPADHQIDLEEFETNLKDLRDVGAEIQPMVDAWSAGDQDKLEELLNGDLDKFPKTRKALLEDRNARWLPKIESMLAQRHTYFITVGAGHLTGRAGLPGMLRRAGYRVDGP